MAIQLSQLQMWEIIDNHTSVLSSFEIFFEDYMYDLSFFFCIRKLHKCTYKNVYYWIWQMFQQAALKALNFNSYYYQDGPPEILRPKLCKKLFKSGLET